MTSREAREEIKLGWIGGGRLCASGHVADGARVRKACNGWMGRDAAGVTHVLARTICPEDIQVAGGRGWWVGREFGGED